jgi:hypothetical protein
MTDKLVFTMPKEWCYAFLAAWRTFERSMNPAFYFLIRCGNCGATGSPKVQPVKSKKKPTAVLGIQCQQCKTALKFEGLIDSKADDFPQRLLNPPRNTVLQLDGEEMDRAGDEAKDFFTLMFE